MNWRTPAARPSGSAPPLLANTPRAWHVVELAAAKAGWASRSPLATRTHLARKYIGSFTAQVRRCR